MAGRDPRRRQLSLAREHTRTNAKEALGYHQHPPETECPTNTFHFSSELCLGFMLVARGGRQTMLVRKWGWAGLLLTQCSNSSGTEWQTTGSSPGHPAWPSSSGHDLLLLHQHLLSSSTTGLSQAVPRAWRQPIFSSDQSPAVGCSSMSLQTPEAA